MAFSQRFSELNPNVEVQWKKRTLQEFADYPIELLTRHYDLLIIDHPWVGAAADLRCVLPLEQYLPADYLNEQALNTVGGSHQTYTYNGHQWALAIDAATPVASYRADLLELDGTSTPSTWEDVLALAKKGKVAVPAIPIDLLMNFYSFCLAHKGEPFRSEEEVVDEETGLLALETMREFYALVDKNFFTANPIAVAEALSTSNDWWYCPFAYGYSNYARTGYARHRLTYCDVVSFNGMPLRTTVGGTGLAVSAFSQHKERAVEFARQIVSPQIQSAFYVEHGGQPGHLSAWKSPTANALCHDYFTTVLPAMQRGYIRPRYHGYLHFQDRAGDPLQRYLQHGGNAGKLLQEMNAIYRHSLSLHPHKTYA